MRLQPQQRVVAIIERRRIWRLDPESVVGRDEHAGLRRDQPPPGRDVLLRRAHQIAATVQPQPRRQIRRGLLRLVDDAPQLDAGAARTPAFAAQNGSATEWEEGCPTEYI